MEKKVNDIFDAIALVKMYAKGMEETIEDLLESNEELICEVSDLKEKLEK